MPNLVKQDIRAFILSVEKTPRNPKITTELTSLGIPYEIVTGATPELAFEYSREIQFEGQYRAEMSKQQMACTFGHRLMFLKAMECKEKYFLFFEDDALIDFEIFTNFISIVTRIPKGLFLLGACGGFAKKYMNIDNFSVLRTVGDTAAGSHAYLADSETIPDLLSGTEGCKFLADSFARSSTKQFVILPYCAYQLKNSFTYIPLHSTAVKHSRIRNLLAPLKMDLIDYFHTGTLGGRFLRLSNVEPVAKKIFVPLPGCTDD